MPYPGSFFTTISGKIKSIVNGPTTERLLIIGTAQDGPINRPVKIENVTDAEILFGPVTYTKGYYDPTSSTESGKNSSATIPLAVAQAFAAGCADVWVCRATGTYAGIASAFTNKLDIQALYPGRIYNQVTYSSSSNGANWVFSLGQPARKGGNLTLTVASGTTISEFIDQLNSDRRNQTVFIRRESWPLHLATAVGTLGTSGTVTLSGGTNGTRATGDDYATSVSGYATMLATPDTGTFESLLGQKFRFNLAVLTGIYIDDEAVGGSSANTIATDFIVFLDKASSEINPCHGVIGCRPPLWRSDSSIIDWVNNNLLATSAGYYDANSKWLKTGPFLYQGWKRSDSTAGLTDLGCRLSVCAGPQVVYSHPDIGSYTDNFHVSYAALLTTVAPERAPIFKPLPGVLGYGTPIPAKYAQKLVEGVAFDPTNDLSGKGAYVCLTRSPRNPDGPLVVFDDCTVTERDDYMRNYQLIHLCNAIHSQCDFSLSSFLGGPTNAAALSAMETKVQNILDGYVESGALRGGRGSGYDFEITMSGTDEALGIVRVHMSISPARALRKIYFMVTVRQ